MIIAVDIGTTSTKVILFDAKGNVIFQVNENYPTIHTDGLRSEQNPELIFAAVLKGLMDCLAYNSEAIIEGVSFSSAMHALIAVDAHCEELTPCIIWSDNRAYKQAEEINSNEILANEIYKITGTPIHSMSPLTKLIWLKRHAPEIFNTAYKFIGIKEYVLWRLTGKFIIDYSIASATGLLDIQTKKWSEKCLTLTGITENQLSELVSPYQKEAFNIQISAANFKLSTFSYEKLKTDCANLKIIIGGSDGGLANWGSGARAIGDAVISIGTSGAMRLMSDKPFFDAQRRTFCYVFDENLYLIGGGTNAGAGVLQWLHDSFFGLTDPMSDFLKLADEISVGSENLLFLPYINGERAPIWNAHIRGSFLCMGALHTRAHAVRAAMEGVIFHLNLLNQILKESHSITRIIAGGGFAHSTRWVQILADVFNMKIEITETVEISALGAAMVGVTALELSELPNPNISATYIPHSENIEKYKLHQKRFIAAYDAVKNISKA